MSITVRRAGSEKSVTTLTGEVSDQAALMGVLSTLYDMGYPLLKVERLGGWPVTEDPDRSRETIQAVSHDHILQE
jgi:hypothetical protein